MEIHLVIRAKPGGAPLTYDAWCELVRQRPDFVRPTPIVGKLPSTDEAWTFYPRPDAAMVVIGGRKVAGVGWSESGEDEVIVSGEADDIVPLARELAAALRCEFAELTQ